LNRETDLLVETRADGHPFELLISGLLRAGVLISLAILVLGLIVSFVHHPSYLSNPPDLQRLTRPGAAFPRTLPEVLAGVAALRGQALITVGLLVLLLTPVARVTVSIFAFALQRDWIFVTITAAVLGLLLLSFALGQAAK
jgi:uncharacterized membrane protein